jgi:hypothetical protein
MEALHDLDKRLKKSKVTPEEYEKLSDKYKKKKITQEIYDREYPLLKKEIEDLVDKANEK